MPRSAPEQVAFRYDEWEPVLVRIAELEAVKQGWINLFPEATEPEDPDLVTPTSTFGTLFRGRAPQVPMGTWVAATDKAPASVGISHGARQKVAPLLREAGIFAPERWQLVQDNPRRGLVVRVPPDEVPEEILAWLMSAIDELCPVVISGHWLAEIHR